MPANFDTLWKKLKYISSTTGKECIELVRFMKFLYSVVCPDGAFLHNYVPARRAEPKPPMSFESVPEQKHPPRINPVVFAKFRKGEVLGNGGQGIAYRGDYEGRVCVGKTFFAKPDDNLVREMENEVRFFLAIDHPNCHYMLGAKTTLDNGGILMLTELCDNGSLFDLYTKSRITFDRMTQLRVIRECAAGKCIAQEPATTQSEGEYRKHVACATNTMKRDF